MPTEQEAASRHSYYANVARWFTQRAEGFYTLGGKSEPEEQFSIVRTPTADPSRFSPIDVDGQVFEFSFDKNGNVTGDRNNRYIYDYKNRLVAVQSKVPWMRLATAVQHNAVTKVKFWHDPLDRLIKRVEDRIVTGGSSDHKTCSWAFYYSGSECRRQSNNCGRDISFLWGPRPGELLALGDFFREDRHYFVHEDFGGTAEFFTQPLQSLFVIAAGNQKELNDGRIPQSLIRGFEQIGIRLSGRVTVSILERNSGWLLKDHGNENAFTIRKEGNQLGVFRNDAVTAAGMMRLGGNLCPSVRNLEMPFPVSNLRYEPSFEGHLRNGKPLFNWDLPVDFEKRERRRVELERLRYRMDIWAMNSLRRGPVGALVYWVGALALIATGNTSAEDERWLETISDTADWIGPPGALDLIPGVAEIDSGIGFGVDASAGDFCFLAGTLVRTEGGLKPIEEIVVGDRVLSRNEENGEQDYRSAVRLFRNRTERIVSVTVFSAETGNAIQTIHCTPGHPWFVHGEGWTFAAHLSAGNRLAGCSGQALQVLTIEFRDLHAQTYNFEVEDWHTYFVGRHGTQPFALVHNISSRRLRRLRDTAPSITEGDRRTRSLMESVNKRSRALQSKIDPWRNRVAYSAGHVPGPKHSGRAQTVLSATKGQSRKRGQRPDPAVPGTNLVEQKLTGETIISGSKHAEINLAEAGATIIGAGIRHCPDCVIAINNLPGVVLAGAKRPFDRDWLRKKLTEDEIQRFGEYLMKP